MLGMNQKDEVLRSALLRYFLDVVTIRKEEMRSAKEVVLVFVDILKTELQSSQSALQLKAGEPIYSGSVWEGLKTEEASEFDVVFPLILDADAWDCKVQLNQYSTYYAPYICFMKSGNHSREDASILRRYGGQDIDGKTPLDPIKVKKAFENQVIRSFKARPIGRYRYDYKDNSETAAAVTMNVCRASTPERKISVDLVPCLQIKKSNGDEVLLVPQGDDGPYWRRSFSVLEKNLLKNIDEKDNGCRKKVLRILKTVFSESKRSRLGPLINVRSFLLKNAVMHLHQSGDWSEDNIAGCFKRVLSYLEECFSKGEMPEYHEKNYNILKKQEPDALKHIAGFLRNIRERNDYIKLL